MALTFNFFCYKLTTYLGQLAQLVRASRLHREGQRFESFIAHHAQRCLRDAQRPTNLKPPIWRFCGIMGLC